MNYFEYKDDILFAEQVDVRTIAQQVGTPCYIYSRATLERHWHAFDDVLQNHDHWCVTPLKPIPVWRY